MAQYIIQHGDSLWSVAKKQLGNPIRWKEIAQLNGLKVPSQLYIGQSLALPEKSGSKPLGSYAPLDKAPFLLDQGLSSHRINGYPVQAFFFMIGDEINPFTETVVRKVAFPYKIKDDANLVEIILNPDKYGFYPRDPYSDVTIARHVDGMTNSKYVSVSDHFLGAPRFEGKRYWINMNKVRKHGSAAHYQDTIQASMDKLKMKKSAELQSALENLQKVLRGEKPWANKEKAEARVQAAERSLQKTEDLSLLSLKEDGEILIQPPEDSILAIPPQAVKGATAQALTHGVRFVSYVGIVFSGYDLFRAGKQSYQQDSFKPLEKESIRQTGGWGGGAIGGSLAKRAMVKILTPTAKAALRMGGRAGAAEGMEIGGEMGAAFTVETGPGAIVGAAIGSAIFGAIGYFAGDWIADHLDKEEK